MLSNQANSTSFYFQDEKQCLITAIFTASSNKLLIHDEIQSYKKAKKWVAVILAYQHLTALRDSILHTHLSRASYLHKQKKD